MGLREPTAEDAAALGEVHVAAWRAGYRGGLMPDDYLDRLDVQERARWWADVLSRSRPPTSAYYVAHDGSDRIVGFITVGAEDGGGQDATRGEVYALNIHPAAWGEGYGRALLEAGTRALAAAGYEHAVLWVHPGNERARRFYERNGWEPTDDERSQEVHGVEVPEVRYQRPLAPGGA